MGRIRKAASEAGLFIAFAILATLGAILAGLCEDRAEKTYHDGEETDVQK